MLETLTLLRKTVYLLILLVYYERIQLRNHQMADACGKVQGRGHSISKCSLIQKLSNPILLGFYGGFVN